MEGNATESPATVLVVEDDEELFDLTRMILDIGGYEPILARTGEEALSLLDTSTPDVILLDIRLPGMSGWDVLDYLAARSRRARVIPLSAHTSSPSFERALRAGCMAYVTKPFRAADLLRTVSEALARPAPLLRSADDLTRGGEGKEKD